MAHSGISGREAGADEDLRTAPAIAASEELSDAWNGADDEDEDDFWNNVPL